MTTWKVTTIGDWVANARSKWNTRMEDIKTQKSNEQLERKETEEKMTRQYIICQLKKRAGDLIRRELIRSEKNYICVSVDAERNIRRSTVEPAKFSVQQFKRNI